MEYYTQPMLCMDCSLIKLNQIEPIEEQVNTVMYCNPWVLFQHKKDLGKLLQSLPTFPHDETYNIFWRTSKEILEVQHKNQSPPASVSVSTPMETCNWPYYYTVDFWLQKVDITQRNNDVFLEAWWAPYGPMPVPATHSFAYRWVTNQSPQKSLPIFWTKV